MHERKMHQGHVARSKMKRPSRDGKKGRRCQDEARVHYLKSTVSRDDLIKKVRAAVRGGRVRLSRERVEKVLKECLPQ